jgi:hypothetical protein
MWLVHYRLRHIPSAQQHDITNIFAIIYEVQWLTWSVRRCCENTMELAVD